MNGTLYFSADDGINGEELWKSDGTSAGTVMVKDIRAGSMGGLNISNIQYFQAYKGFVYFSANDGTTGVELWKSDGTSNGTVLVKDIRSGNITSDLKELIVYNDLLYFSAYDGLSGTQLWKSDGTSSGTMLAFTKGPSSARSLTVMGDNLYFRGSSTTTGEELYKYDGSAAIPNDSIILSVNSLNFSKSSSTKQVQLNSNRNWTASGQASWVTLTPNSGSGNATLNITASTNTSSVSRSNTITFTAGTATKTLLVTQDATVSISEINKNNYLNIYPNPTSGIVTIASTQAIADIDVFDVTGKLVYSQNNIKQHNSSIDLLSLSNGIYFIHAQTENGGVNISKVVLSK
jgi:ELWxxDGT repeat protein